MIPNEVIIVEGRDDTKRLIETFGPAIKTIETNGSAISRKVQAQILAAAEQFDIIIFTDPDYQGERIRRIVTELVPNAKQAYLTQTQADSGKRGASLGIEHAAPETIRQALNQLVTPLTQVGEEIPMADLVRLKLSAHPEAKKRRQRVSEYFRLGHLNAKQLQKKLAQYQITVAQIEQCLNEEENE